MAGGLAGPVIIEPLRLQLKVFQLGRVWQKQTKSLKCSNKSDEQKLSTMSVSITFTKQIQIFMFVQEVKKKEFHEV